MRCCFFLSRLTMNVTGKTEAARAIRQSTIVSTTNGTSIWSCAGARHTAAPDASAAATVSESTRRACSSAWSAAAVALAGPRSTDPSV